MWCVDPKMMCRKHLLGEHVECHMFVGAILKGKSISGYVERGLVEVHNIQARHDVLASEITSRGYNHVSPLPIFQSWVEGSVNTDLNIVELMSRCENCRGLIENYRKKERILNDNCKL